MPKINAFEKRRESFRQLHEKGCFALPNPWNAGSARRLTQLGFKALASTSTGFAWSRGLADHQASLEQVLAHLRELVAATDLPINADFENGFAADSKTLERHVAQVIDTGVAGFSIEDSTRDPDHPQLSCAEAVERIQAARSAIDAGGQNVVLVGRAENFFVGNASLPDTIERLQAYATAGADCLYAPGLTSIEQITTVVDALAPKPVNVLIGWPSGLSMSQLAALGVRRVSVGGALARAAWAGFEQAAQTLLRDGSFNGFANATPGSELNQWFKI